MMKYFLDSLTRTIMNEEAHEEDGPTMETISVNDSVWYTADALPILEQLFPTWIIGHCQAGHGPRFLSRNSAAFFGISFDELTRQTCHTLLERLYPDDREPYLRVLQRIDEMLKSLEPAEALRYRFTIQYRMRRHRSYLTIYEERSVYLDEQDRLNQFMLFRDVSAERAFGRVQLDWYHTNLLGYQRIGSYVPAMNGQELTAREAEVVQLIQDGFSSKEIADRLHISTNTVRNHRSNLFRKTQARNMVDLVHHTRQANEVV